MLNLREALRKRIRGVAQIECRYEDRPQAFGVCDIIGDIEPTLPLRRATISDREQTRQVRVCRAIFRISDEVRRSIAKDESRADDKANIALSLLAQCFRLHMRAHDAGQRIAISDTTAGEPKRARLLHHFFRVRARAEE